VISCSPLYFYDFHKSSVSSLDSLNLVLTPFFRPSPSSPPTRLTTTIHPPPDKCPSFLITAANRSYKHQYANIYFVRLRLLRDVVEQRARKRWKAIAGALSSLTRRATMNGSILSQGDPILVPRVLEVEKSQLCYIVGTVYMDMPLKPNVLEDIARDVSAPSFQPFVQLFAPCNFWYYTAIHPAATSSR
jgi:DNA polymerase delta subunit 2